MTFLETTDVESKSFPNIACPITEYRQPNRFLVVSLMALSSHLPSGGSFMPCFETVLHTGNRLLPG